MGFMFYFRASTPILPYPQSPLGKSASLSVWLVGPCTETLKRFGNSLVLNVPEEERILLGPKKKPIYYDEKGYQRSNQITQEHHQKFLNLINRVKGKLE